MIKKLNASTAKQRRWNKNFKDFLIKVGTNTLGKQSVLFFSKKKRKRRKG